MFEKGTSVRLKIYPIEGKILKNIIIDDNKISCLVEYEDEFENTQQGYFPEEKLEEII